MVLKARSMRRRRLPEVPEPAVADALDRERVEEARLAAVVLRWLAVAAFVLAIVGLAGIIWAWIAGQIKPDQAFALATGSGFLAILSAGTAYGTAAALDVSTSRLERQIPRQPGGLRPELGRTPGPSGQSGQPVQSGASGPSGPAGPGPGEPTGR